MEYDYNELDYWMEEAEVTTNCPTCKKDFKRSVKINCVPIGILALEVCSDCAELPITIVGNNKILWEKRYGC